MRNSNPERYRPAKERCDLDVLLREAIKSTTHLTTPREGGSPTPDALDSHRRGPLGRLWARLQWSWEFGAFRRWWLQLWPPREPAEATQPRWAVAQTLTALVLPGAVVYLLLSTQLNVIQVVMAVQIGLSLLIGRGW
jgi:hypothetical protein